MISKCLHDWNTNIIKISEYKNSFWKLGCYICFISIWYYSSVSPAVFTGFYIDVLCLFWLTVGFCTLTMADLVGDQGVGVQGQRRIEKSTLVLIICMLHYKPSLETLETSSALG